MHTDSHAQLVEAPEEPDVELWEDFQAARNMIFGFEVPPTPTTIPAPPGRSRDTLEEEVAYRQVR